ncbi:MAG TPA: polyprenyl synthetase family protein, partial [Thermoplasmatales archaeon]|nr:polyprenyl synthetase family protein [Thermoplasmatales archaeon]
SCATKGGAIIGGGSKEEIDALAAYGRFFGLSFQIWDDYLDLCGKQQEIGKVIGNDIRDGKKTLILTHALEHTQDKQRRILLSVLGKNDASDEEIHRVVKVLTDSGSIEYAKEKACGYVDQAKHELNTLKDSEARELLKELADYTISRKR